jgi:hypothetical protein
MSLFSPGAHLGQFRRCMVVCKGKGKGELVGEARRPGRLGVWGGAARAGRILRIPGGCEREGIGQRGGEKTIT